MKHFSMKWRQSSRPGKQRKFRANAPAHVKHKMLSSTLSKELRKKYSRRSFPLRKGDMVEIMVGKFRKKKGKVLEIRLDTMKVYIESMQITKKDGSKVNVPFNASNLRIMEFNLDDKKRIEALGRNKK